MPTSIARGQRALRSVRVSLPCHCYFLTTVCFERRACFARREVAGAVSKEMTGAPLWRSCRLLAWVLMPDHWHGLVELGEEDSLARLMQRFKSVTSRTASSASDMAGPIWQRGFHDRALRSDENVIAAARYLVANPLRAGLVSRVAEYPFWGCVWAGEEMELA